MNHIKGDIYIKISNGISEDSEIISFVDLNDLLAISTYLPWTTDSVNISSEYTKSIITPSGDIYGVGEFLKVSFDSAGLDYQTWMLLKEMLEGRVDVIMVDMENNLLIGVENIIPNLTLVNVNDIDCIHIAGECHNMNAFKWYKIQAKGVIITFPKNGYIYNSSINNVFGYIN